MCNFSLALPFGITIGKRDLNMFMDVLTLDFLKQYGDEYDYFDYAAEDEQGGFEPTKKDELQLT